MSVRDPGSLRQDASTDGSTVELVPLRDALALGREVWAPLQASAAIASPFMTWAWHRSWTEAAPPGDVASSRAFLLRSRGGRLESVFPFRLFQAQFRRVPLRALGWAIHDLGCPDHLDLLASPQADLGALVAELERLPWDVMLLDNVGQCSPNVDRLSAACERRGWTVHRLPISRCPYLVLPDSWAGYLAGLSSNRRQALRRSERVLHREYAVTLTDYGTERLEEGWRCLHSLHLRRWGSSGHLAAPAMSRLHARFASLLPPRGAVWLASLELDAKPVAAWYGFAMRDTVYFYQSGWDPTYRRRSVGNVLTGMMVRRAIEQGYRCFDFLRGEEPYKRVWTGLARTCYRVVILRPGWRGTALRWLDRLARLRSAVSRATRTGLGMWLSYACWVARALMDAA